MALQLIYRQIVRLLVHFQFLSNLVPDKQFLQICYRAKTGKKLDLDNPKTFNEKIQWLKLYNRKAEYTGMVDKYEAKKIVADIIGEKYIIPTIASWDSVDDIDFQELPSRFVLKCNHNSGLGMCICKDKSKLNIKETKKMLKKGLRQDYYFTAREWPYKNVHRRIIAEKFIEDGTNHDLKDYKVFVFNGTPTYIQVDIDRFTNHRRNFYSTDWEYIPFTTEYPTDPDYSIPRPPQLEELLNVVKKLTAAAGDPPFLRVDMYILENSILFGELTFFHGAGFEHFYPPEYDLLLGNMIKISK